VLGGTGCSPVPARACACAGVCGCWCARVQLPQTFCSASLPVAIFTLA
jgi:hypothetical protein